MIEAGTRVIVAGEPGTVREHPAAIYQHGIRVLVELDSSEFVTPSAEDVELEGS